jgi:hypothetical protein
MSRMPVREDYSVGELVKGIRRLIDPACGRVFNRYAPALHDADLRIF